MPSGVSIYKESSLDSEEIIKIPHLTIVKIIAFSGVFQDLNFEPEVFEERDCTPEEESENEQEGDVEQNYTHYGQWVKIEYKTSSATFIGFVFDDFLDYQLPKEGEAGVFKDTVTVTNEKEFVAALSSNRVIWIDMDTLNIEAYQRNLGYVDPNLIVDYSKEMPFDTATHYYSESSNEDSLHSFGLYGFENLEIRGKNRLVSFIVEDSWIEVLAFNSCKNMLIDNINFYHRVFDENTCSGSVTTFKNCSSMRFQNTHFDGSGTVGNDVCKSENFTFLNCEYYRNSIAALQISESKEITLIRADIYENDLYDIFQIYNSQDIYIAESYLKYNSVIDHIFEIRESPSLKLELNHTKISRNTIKNNIVNISKSDQIKLLINNSVITKNVSKKNKYMIAIAETNSPKLSFKNSDVKNNKDFYGLVNDSTVVVEESNFTEENKFNRASDSILTKFNSIGDYVGREFKDITYDSITKQFKHKSYLLNGKHQIFISKKDSIVFLPIGFDSDYNLKGTFVDGKLAGSWEMNSGYYTKPAQQYKMNFKEGVLHGELLFYYNNNILLKKGLYINGKKEDIWEYYSPEGILQKKITYQNNKPSGFSEYYFRNGVLREQRTDDSNKNGITTSYYPNGKTESKITYENGTIDLKNTTFLDTNGEKKKAIAYELTYVKNEEGKLALNIDFAAVKYKNKVHVLYTKNKEEVLGYQYYKDGKLHGVSKVFINGEKITTGDYITIKKGEPLNVVYYENGVSKQGKSWFLYDSNNNLILSSTKTDDGRLMESKYNGELNCLIDYIEFKKIGGKYKLHGVHKRYNNYGKMLKELRYENGEKI